MNSGDDDICLWLILKPTIVFLYTSSKNQNNEGTLILMKCVLSSIKIFLPSISFWQTVFKHTSIYLEGCTMWTKNWLFLDLENAVHITAEVLWGVS